jgi:Uri superfamily endonuclease
VVDDLWVATDRIDAIPGQTRGSYVLLIRLDDESVISVGNQGRITFLPGYYAYAGSAMNGLRHRLSRHINSEKKKHWHIDYLLERAAIIDIAVHETDSKSECAIAGALGSEFDIVPGFGCSDCRCPSHLFYSSKQRRLRAGIESAMIKPDTGR